MLNNHFIHTFVAINYQTKMKRYRLAILAFAVTVSAATYGQLFRPLGLGVDKCERVGYYFQPQMNVEGDFLYVCTNQGLYSKDLSTKESTWQLVGFEDIPLQDYARRGEDILALRYNESGSFLLLSHDGGKTYEDVTPDLFGEYKDMTHVLISLVQHPADPNTLLVSSYPLGLFQSSDFGQTWDQLTDIVSEHIGYHPLNPEIIYESGNNLAYVPYFNISYDGGQTWSYLSPNFGGDNCANRIAFHPTDLNRWIVGGFGVVATSADNGHTWDMQSLSGVRDGLWAFTAYDNENSDIIYMAGRLAETLHVMYSTDGGETWSVPQTDPMKNHLTEKVYDLKQQGGKLLFYTESDVYEISKAELLAQATSVRTITTAIPDASSEIYDLQGRRLSAIPQKGVYIQNGKKKVVK